MNRCAIFAIAALVVFTLASVAAAQDAAAPSVDQILDKYVTALGGKANLEKITSRYYKGDVEIPEAPAKGTVELFAKAPNKVITIAEITGLGTFRDGFDGSVAWSDNPQAGMRTLEGQELENTRRGAEFYSPLKLREMYATITVKGKEKVGAREAWVLKATFGSNAPDELAFDADSGLLIRAIRTRNSDQGPVTSEVYYDEYKLVDGVQVVTTQRRFNPTFTVITRFTDFKHNVPIDDSKFAKPATP